MGYEIHITRQEEWSEDDPTRRITQEEWRALARSDVSLRAVPENGPDFFELVDGEGWFDFSDGCLVTKHPDDRTLAKAYVIAARLNAKIQGDDGELYFANGKIVEPEPPPSVRAMPQWIVYVACVMVILGLISLIIRAARALLG